MNTLTLLDAENPEFPNPEHALADPNGLLAVGGNLKTATLIEAYRAGIFPWFNDGEEIMWWSPDPRTVIFPKEINISRSLRKLMRPAAMEKAGLDIRFDTAFTDVINNCASIERHGQQGTWITDELRASILSLYVKGVAHSVEVWKNDELVGGLYGLMFGRLFCGESMFSHESNASKIALVALAKRMSAQVGDAIIDCQVASAHLQSMGAVTIPRREFLARAHILRDSCFTENIFQPWKIH